MRLDDLQLYLNRINSELFSFSFALIPDELQAHQVVVDSICVLMLRETSLIRELADETERKREIKKLSNIRKFLYKNILKLGKKRFRHVEAGLNAGTEFAPFFCLGLEDKAVLFLKHKTVFSLDDISWIFGKSRSEVIVRLNCARNSLSGNLGRDFGMGIMP